MGDGGGGADVQGLCGTISSFSAADSPSLKPMVLRWAYPGKSEG